MILFQYPSPLRITESVTSALPADAITQLWKKGFGTAALLPALSLFIIAMCSSLSASATETQERGSYEGAIETVYPDWFKTSFLELEEDVAEAREAGKRLMLVFHQDGCPYCNAFVERNLAQKDIEQKVRENFDAIEINLWGDLEVTNIEGGQYTEKTFAEQLKVQFTPTVLFYNEEGEFALRINGYYPPEKFRHALDFVIGKHDKSESFNEYLSRQQAPATESIDNDLSSRPYITGNGDKLASAAKEDKPIILLFEQADCSNCQQLDNKVLKLEQTNELLSAFNVIRLNMWGKQIVSGVSGEQMTERELAKSLGVSYAPTLIFYASDGEKKTEVIRSESWFKRFHTQSMMDYVASDAWQQESNFQRYISARAEAIREKGHDVNIFD